MALYGLICSVSIQHDAERQSNPLSPLWLRLQDPKQFTPNGQRLLEISTVATDPECTTVLESSSDSCSLRVKFGDGEETSFPMEWLEKQVKHAGIIGSDGSARSDDANAKVAHLWGSGFQPLLPRLAYDDFESETGKLRLCAYLDRYGIAVLERVPCRPSAVEDLVGNKMGFVRNTNYGSIFDVIDLGSEGNSLAQTSCRIPAHTDNPYRDPYPGVQLLHCLESGKDGGATTFCDGFAAAEVLRRADADAFAMLAETPCLFEYLDPTQGVWLKAEVPVIKLGYDGRTVERVAFNNRSARVPRSLRGDEASLRSYYQAWAKFDQIVNSAEHTVQVQLSPGDCAIFSNSRVMHGREEYTPGKGKARHLQGCYVDHDALRSRVGWAEAHGVEGQQQQLGGPTYDVHAQATQKTMEAMLSQAEFSYGEGVDMLQHALQAAYCASAQGEATDAVLAAVMHDIGNSPQARAAWVAA